MPALRDATIEEGINGVFSFTPDGIPLMGESPDVAGFWVAEAVWVTHSAGVGQAMAEWLVDGAPPTDLHECDVNRFEPHQLGPGLHPRPRHARTSSRSTTSSIRSSRWRQPRPLRTSPVLRARAGARARLPRGRPAGSGRSGTRRTPALLERYDGSPSRNAWAARYWSPIAGAEALATRDGVALYDMTSLKRLEVRGPGALAFLDGLTTNRARPPRRDRSSTPCCSTSDGGIRSDLTIARLGAGPVPGRRQRQPRPRLADAARAAGRLGRRPRHHRRHVLHRAVGAARPRPPAAADRRGPVSNEALRLLPGARRCGSGTCRSPRCACRYVGELGWELYTTADLGLKLWDTLWAAGQPYGLIAAGRSAFGSLRLEKGYRSWGADMTTEHDPYEAGLGLRGPDGQGRLRR